MKICKWCKEEFDENENGKTQRQIQYCTPICWESHRRVYHREYQRNVAYPRRVRYLKSVWEESFNTLDESGWNRKKDCLGRIDATHDACDYVPGSFNHLGTFTD
jgi:hypothetical protein